MHQTFPLEEPQALPLSEENQGIDYKNITVVELKELAKEKCIQGYSSMNRQELIESIKASV